MLRTLNRSKSKTYVGFTNNLNMRLERHNTNKGAKSTKGHKWEIIYSKHFKKKTDAMSYEYKLKKDRKKRASIIKIHNDSKV